MRDQDRCGDHGPSGRVRDGGGERGDLLIVDGDVMKDIALLEDRRRFIAVMQGGVIKAGQLTRTGHTWGNATKMG